jgi:transglutaminase-like putative cysteine protease
MKKQPPRWWDWPSAVLLSIAILVSTWRLGVTNWTPNLGYTSRLAALGVLIGMALGYSRFERRAVAALGIAYTLVMIPRQLMQAIDPGIQPGERFLELLGRWLFALREFAGGHPVTDPLFLVSILSVIYWIIGLTAGYHLVRRADFFASVLPAGLVMFVVHLYDKVSPERTWWLAVFLLLSLILLARLNYLRNHARWRDERIYVSSETGLNLSNGILIAAAAFVVIAWSLPSTIPYAPSISYYWNSLTKPWREVRERLEDAFASVESQGVDGDGFRGQLLLGSSAPQSNEVVLTVSIPPQALDFPRLYWRGQVYDVYENNRWTASETDSIPFSPAVDELQVSEDQGRTALSLTYQVRTREQSIFYTASPIQWISRSADVLYFRNPDDPLDLVTLLPSPFLGSGETYRARAALNDPSVSELRASGETYPSWVMERYLQLPDDFSPRLRALAKEITTGIQTPYDKAEAITNYLRENVAYKPEIYIPPETEDLIEYSILDLKQGYCNYYATAEALMLRSLGIPARLAVGYAQGALNQEKDTFIVRRRDTHAWPEVYFTGIGWVEFEPTANQGSIVRPDRPRTNLAPAPREQGNLPTEDSQQSINEVVPSKNPVGFQRTILPILVAITAGAVLFFLDRRFAIGARLPLIINSAIIKTGSEPPVFFETWARWSQLLPVERSFHAINLSLRLLGRPLPVYATPAERAAALSEILPGASKAIDFLADQYQQSIYGHGANIQPRAAVNRASRSILWQALRARLNEAGGKYRSRL